MHYAYLISRISPNVMLAPMHQVAQAQVEEATNMRKNLDEDRVFDSKPSNCTNSKTTEQTSKKSAAAIAAEVADKLAASTSSQYIMTSVLSTFAAEEAKNAGLSTSATSASSFSSGNVPVPDPNAFVPNPSQNPYQVSNSQAHYHSIPNPNPPPIQYMQPSGGIAGSYDYSNISSLPPAPPQQYMVSSMVPLMQQMVPMGQQPSTMPQQQLMVPQQTPGSFRPIQSPGMVYYNHPYRSQ